MRFILILLMLALVGCGGSQAVAPVGVYRAQSQQAPPTVYKVKRGDTLYSVSWRFGKDFKTVARINGIDSPYTIYVGQKLRFKPYKQVAKKSSNKASTAKKTSTTKRNLNVLKNWDHYLLFQQLDPLLSQVFHQSHTTYLFDQEQVS